MIAALLLAAVLQQPAPLQLAGRPLAEALQEIDARGLKVTFTTDLVRPDMRVAAEPKATHLHDIADEILAPFGLTTRPGPDGTLVVVLKFTESIDVSSAEPENIGRKPIEVPAARVVAMPGGLENIFHTLQLLPGVTATSDFGSRQSVRGGGPDENLIVMDHIELHNPYRLFGFVSGINPETVQQFELHAGAFSAQYGDRLSSLLVIDTRDGSTKKSVQGLASASITDANVVVEGRLPRSQRGSWLVTGRRTYYDLIAGHLSTDVRKFPGFTDGQFKLVWNPAARWRVTFHGLASGESMDLSSDTKAPGEFKDAATARTTTTLFAVTVETNIGGRTLLRTTASASALKDRFDLTADGCDPILRTNTRDNGGFCEEPIVVGHVARARDSAIRQELVLARGRHAFDLGVQARGGRNELSATAFGDNFPAIALPGLGMIGIGHLPWHVDNAPFTSSIDGNAISAWSEDRVQATSRLSVVPGVRVDHIGFTGETAISPRFAFSMALGDRTTFSGSTGVHYQSPGYDKAFLGGAAFALNLTSPEAAPLKSERAVQTVVGVERELRRGLSLRVEGYDRGLDRLIVGRLETEVERQQRIAQYLPLYWPGPLQSDIPTDPLITSVPVNAGSGRARGLEVLLTKRPRSTEARFTGWISYTLSKADRQTYGLTYPFDYDRRHAASAVGDWRVSPRVTASAAVQAASGFPVTVPNGTRIATLGGGTSDEPLVFPFFAGQAHGAVYQVDYGSMSRINSSRLPASSRVDFRATLHPRDPKGHWTFYVDVINVLNRRNQLSVFSDLGYNPAGERPIVVNTYGGGFPILPTVGLKYRF
jgi:hypothetical protein